MKRRRKLDDKTAKIAQKRTAKADAENALRSNYPTKNGFINEKTLRLKEQKA